MKRKQEEQNKMRETREKDVKEGTRNSLSIITEK